jgi:hypothetical protein
MKLSAAAAASAAAPARSPSAETGTASVRGAAHVASGTDSTEGAGAHAFIGANIGCGACQIPSSASVGCATTEAVAAAVEVSHSAAAEPTAIYNYVAVRNIRPPAKEHAAAAVPIIAPMIPAPAEPSVETNGEANAKRKSRPI